MGCFGSRDSQRQGAYGEDFNLVPYGFRKADLSNLAAFAPVDKLAAEFIGEEKDIMESKLGEFKDMNFSKADELKQVAAQIFGLVKTVYKNAKDDSNDKENAIGMKYSVKDVTEQLDKVLTALAATDAKLEWPEKEEGKADENKDKEEEKKKEEPAAAGETKEGGEADEVQFDGGEKKDDAPAEKSDFCKVLLDQVVGSPVLFDILKSAVLSVELDSFDPLDFGKLGKMAVSLLPLFPDPSEWAGAAAILSIAVNTLEGEPKDKEIFGKIKCSEDDLAELTECADNKDKAALIFPGLTIWNAEESGCAAPKGPEGSKEITFKLKNSKYHEVDGKFVICRYIGKIDDVNEEKTVYTLSEYTDYVFDSIKDWKAKVEKGDIAAVAAGAAAKPEEKKDENKGKDDK